ncbi:MAG: hypothetical protein PVI87_10020, partial [Gammaproteobacteria bacterium]
MKISMKLMRWPAFLLVAAFTFGCGSSGGGSDVVVDDDEFIILPVYTYQLTSTSDDPVTITVPLWEGGFQELQFGHLFDGPGLFGTYQPDDGAFTVEAGSSLAVSHQGPFSFGNFSVQAIVDWFVPGDSNPDTGALEVARGDERIEVAVINGGNTVRMRWDAAGDGVYEESVELTWQEFDDLGVWLEDPDWQIVGSFAYDITLEYVFELAQFGIEGFDFLTDELEQAGQVVVECTAFSDLGLSVPPTSMPSVPGFPDQGLLTFSWLDDTPNGSVGPGDSFTMAFNACLDDDPFDDYDDMYTGNVGLNSLTEVYEQRAAGETLIRIGWEGSGVAGRPGGIDFSDLWLWEVWDADGDGPETVAAAR